MAAFVSGIIKINFTSLITSATNILLVVSSFLNKESCILLSRPWNLFQGEKATELLMKEHQTHWYHFLYIYLQIIFPLLFFKSFYYDFLEMHMYLVISLIKMIFNVIYNIIKGFKKQLTIKVFWMIMGKTVIWTLGMIKIR